jgi:hypothetical protein
LRNYDESDEFDESDRHPVEPFNYDFGHSKLLRRHGCCASAPNKLAPDAVQRRSWKYPGYQSGIDHQRERHRLFTVLRRELEWHSAEHYFHFEHPVKGGDYG